MLLNKIPKIQTNKSNASNLLLTYLCSLFEFRIIDVKCIYFKALPAWLLVRGLHGLSAPFLPCWDWLKVKVGLAGINIGKEIAFLRFILLVGPGLFHLFKFHLFLALYRWCFLFLFLFWFASISPGIKSLQERFMGFLLVVNSITEGLYVDHGFDLVWCLVLVWVHF